MMRIHTLALSTVLLMTPAFVAGAQSKTDTAVPKPLLSPRDTTRASVGGANVLIDYGRPSKRNREIFGALVPYDKVWRTGANAATTLVTDKDLVIGGTTVPAGTYTLYTLPSKSGWQLIINKQTKQWGTQYDQSQDLARVPMKVAAINVPVEKFEMVFPGDGMLHLRWDTTDASVSVVAK